MDRNWICCLLWVVLGSGLASGQAASVQPPCSDPAYHQFDFWIGSWDVTQGGKPAGTNTITSELAGCALFESWLSANGRTAGRSINYYDADRKSWHQTWIDNSGQPLTLEGTFAQGKMVMRGQRPLPNGKGLLQHRITWTPLASGEVRQLWESSTDNGKSWSVQFDGLYRKRGTPPATRPM
jgi:hypothetical protein